MIRILLGLFIILGTLTIPVLAIGSSDVQFRAMEATAYTGGTITADGSRPHYGICASKPEWIGLTAAVYLDDDGELGDFLGYFEIKDTGGKAVRNGKVLDIYLDSYEECIQFGRKDVWVVLLKGVG